MKTALGILTVFALLGAFAWSLYPPEAEAQDARPPTTLSCTSSSVACSGSTGVCTGAVPDAGTAEGVAIGLTRAYVVYSCPPVGQTITATGSYNDYHCHAATGKCPIVQANTQTITTATTNTTGVSGGQGTGTGGCLELAPFTVPYYDNSSDRMVWVPNGITVSPTDGGSLTTYVCPAQ
jgi:hypothetical protein